MTRIGILLPVVSDLSAGIERCAELGFESVSLTLWEKSEVRDLEAVLKAAVDVARGRGVFVSTLSIYGNPLLDNETGAGVRELWQVLCRIAANLRVPVVSGFAGRIAGKSVEDSLSPWYEFFAPLAEQGAARNFAIAFENCRLGDTWKNGKWNIAINPDAWTMMFDKLQGANVGLEWEPCHQLESLADPIAQLGEWADRVIHVHGKDAALDRGALVRKGFFAKEKWHRSVLPGEGDADWAAICAALQARSFEGSIDIETPSVPGPSLENGLVAEAKSLSYLKLKRDAATRSESDSRS